MDIAPRLLHPALQALLLGGVSMLLVLLRKQVPALVTALVAVAWIWFASTPAVALVLHDGLATPAPGTPPHADAIVVLGGDTLPVNDWSRATTRAGKGLALWRAGLAPVLLVSGSDQARALAQGLEVSGVPPRDLRIEDTSTNTHENARNSALLLRASGSTDILLVTSPIHMRRAAGAFRHEGLSVSAVPTADTHAMLEQAPSWLPRRDALTLTARCLREYVAMWVYRERGWI
ncbi:YdcF family protein [Luteibacter sp. E-22]|uniref:YdcF family protein n=1 Tax=Luteibacter sp. E-22 TaxID=3404050 RepID=UPI003CEA6D88